MNKKISRLIISAKINQNELKSVKKLKKEVLKEFSKAEFVLYGSKVRGNDEEFSDIDVLVLLEEEVTTKIEEKIFSIGYDIGLKHNVVFGIVVESKQFWCSPIAKAMPFHWNVSKEGIPI
ncbi:MAG: nucleotidyltransferase domain-containing protein [Elusimicrobiota bacterium]